MHVKQVTITDFKSFKGKHSFAFKSDLMPILGKNGTGKSNLLDAIAFGCGSMDHKKLRLSSPTDLTCKDSQDTEVTIVFYDHATAKEFIVFRRFEIYKFRNIYKINGLVVTMDDFHNFFDSFLNLSNCWFNTVQFTNMVDYEPPQIWKMIKQAKVSKLKKSLLARRKEFSAMQNSLLNFIKQQKAKERENVTLTNHLAAIGDKLREKILSQQQAKAAYKEAYDTDADPSLFIRDKIVKLVIENNQLQQQLHGTSDRNVVYQLISDNNKKIQAFETCELDWYRLVIEVNKYKGALEIAQQQIKNEQQKPLDDKVNCLSRKLTELSYAIYKLDEKINDADSLDPVLT